MATVPLTTVHLHMNGFVVCPSGQINIQVDQEFELGPRREPQLPDLAPEDMRASLAALCDDGRETLARNFRELVELTANTEAMRLCR